MTNTKHFIWSEKYRPNTLEDYVFFDTRTKDTIETYIKKQNIPHLIFSGTPGLGKSSLAMLLLELLNVAEEDVLKINASKNTGIDEIRTRVDSFVSTFPEGPFKVVRMEEADRLSPHAQDSLKDIIEEYSLTVRFIFNTNRLHKINNAILSRCTRIDFLPMDKNDLTEKVASILVKEKVKFTLPLLDAHIDNGYPDLRLILNNVQDCSQSGTLLAPKKINHVVDENLLELLKSGNWNSMFAAAEEYNPEQFIEAYRVFYTHLKQNKAFTNETKWQSGIVAIAEYMYRHALSADPLINFGGCVAQLGIIECQKN